MSPVSWLAVAIVFTSIMIEVVFEYSEGKAKHAKKLKEQQELQQQQSAVVHNNKSD